MEGTSLIDWGNLERVMRRALHPLALQPADEDDVIQEAFLHILTSSDYDATRGSLEAYAAGVAQKQVLRMHRAAKSRPMNWSDVDGMGDEGSEEVDE